MKWKVDDTNIFTKLAVVFKFNQNLGFGVERPGWLLPFSSERVRGESLKKESEEGENMPYIGPVTSQVMGLRVTNGSWNLCLLSVFTPLCDAEAPGKLSSFTQ